MIWKFPWINKTQVEQIAPQAKNFKTHIGQNAAKPWKNKTQIAQNALWREILNVRAKRAEKFSGFTRWVFENLGKLAKFVTDVFEIDYTIKRAAGGKF